MVWGVSQFPVIPFIHRAEPFHQWAIASFFILFIGLSLGELASAAPTSGGVSVGLDCCVRVSDLGLAALLLDALSLVSQVAKFTCLDLWL